MDSFLFRSLQHLAALQKDSFSIWDALKDENITSYPFFALGTTDGPGLTHLNGLVGHMGKEWMSNVLWCSWPLKAMRFTLLPHHAETFTAIQCSRV